MCPCNLIVHTILKRVTDKEGQMMRGLDLIPDA